MDLYRQSVPAEILPRAWYCTGDDYAFVVKVPITFAHSQLVIKVPLSEPEEEKFKKAAPQISQCLKIMRLTLEKLEPGSLPTLAGYTRTSGDYIRTAVLKANPSESVDEYRIHLIPLFASHLEETDRFHSTVHELEGEQMGGMLSWLGQREQVIDHELRYDPNGQGLINSFNLETLAQKLYMTAEKLISSRLEAAA
jgi:hypothetical protein